MGYRVVAVVGLVLMLAITACGAEESPDVAASGADAEQSNAEQSNAEQSEGESDTGDLGGLTDCDSIPELRSSVDGPLGDFANPPDDVMAALSGYGRSNAEIFGGLWIDRAAGSVVLAVTEDPEVHRAAIAEDLGLDQRDDIAVDVVQVTHTENELLSVLEQLFQGDDRIPSLTSGGPSVTKNVVGLDLIDPTAEDLDRLAATVDPELVCVTVSVAPPRPSGAVEVLSADPVQQRLTCGGSNTFPVSALEDPAPVESSDHPAALAAVGLFDESGEGIELELESMFAEEPELFILDIGEEQALFATIEADGFPGANIRVDRADGDQWRVSGFGGSCNNLAVAYPEGLNQVEIYADADNPPAPDQTEIALLVTERACASGEPMGDRLLEPQVIEEDGRVLVVFAAAANLGAANCPGNPSTPVTITLAEPLGDRDLLDAGVFPAAPIQPFDGDP